jgi:hypothetical protein
MSETYTDAQMALWKHIVRYVWTRWVLPVSILAGAAGFVMGFTLYPVLRGWAQ